MGENIVIRTENSQKGVIFALHTAQKLFLIFFLFLNWKKGGFRSTSNNGNPNLDVLGSVGFAYSYICISQLTQQRPLIHLAEYSAQNVSQITLRPLILPISLLKDIWCPLTCPISFSTLF